MKWLVRKISMLVDNRQPMHPEDCTCEFCDCHEGMAWAVLRIRVICPKCNVPVDKIDRVHERTTWSPAVYCPQCGSFIDIVEVEVQKTGMRHREQAREAT